MSERITQTLVIMKAMLVEFKDVYPVSKQRNEATRILAKEWKITPEAIRDKYTRQLRINAKEFDDLLIRLFESKGKDKELLQLLRKRGDRKDQTTIDEFEHWLEHYFVDESEKGPKIKLAPSILSADFARLGEQVAEATRAGADYIHIDVMDGHFVPQITIGAPVVAAIRSSTTLPLDVHLMIEAPERQIKPFAEAGAHIITVHIEACPHIHRAVEMIKESGVKAGVALNPGTPIESLGEILADLDLVLVMTVNPGFGGQTFIAGMLDKIACLRAELDEKGLAVELEVDGGINAEIAPRVVVAGARVLVAGAAVFHSGETVAKALAKIRASLG